MSRFTALAALCGMLALPAAHAHHSYAMFDGGRKLTLRGTLKQFQWTNPHSFLQVLVPAQGGTQEWSIQLNSPLDLYRAGWRPTTVKPGEAITVVIHPIRNGSHSGSLVSGTGPDGKPLPMN